MNIRTALCLLVLAMIGVTRAEDPKPPYGPSGYPLHLASYMYVQRICFFFLHISVIIFEFVPQCLVGLCFLMFVNRFPPAGISHPYGANGAYGPYGVNGGGFHPLGVIPTSAPSVPIAMIIIYLCTQHQYIASTHYAHARSMLLSCHRTYTYTHTQLRFPFRSGYSGLPVFKNKKHIARLKKKKVHKGPQEDNKVQALAQKGRPDKARFLTSSAALSKTQAEPLLGPVYGAGNLTWPPYLGWGYVRLVHFVFMYLLL